MTAELRLAKMESYATGTLYESPTPRIRNLGDAILLAAIEDYRGLDDEAHEEAALFLYPQTPDWQDQYDWVIGMTVGLDAAWLRDALDRFKAQWDLQRTGGRPVRLRLRRKVSGGGLCR